MNIKNSIKVDVIPNKLEPDTLYQLKTNDPSLFYNYISSSDGLNVNYAGMSYEINNKYRNLVKLIALIIMLMFIIVLSF